MTDFPDRVRMEDLPHLTTKELITLHAQRYKNADAVWGQLMIRVSCLDLCEKQNEIQARLLRQCHNAIKHYDELKPLAQILAEHFEDYNIEETK